MILIFSISIRVTFSPYTALSYEIWVGCDRLTSKSKHILNWNTQLDMLHNGNKCVAYTYIYNGNLILFVVNFRVGWKVRDFRIDLSKHIY